MNLICSGYFKVVDVSLLPCPSESNIDNNVCFLSRTMSHVWLILCRSWKKLLELFHVGVSAQNLFNLFTGREGGWPSHTWKIGAESLTFFSVEEKKVIALNLIRRKAHLRSPHRAKETSDLRQDRIHSPTLQNPGRYLVSH